MTRAEWEALVEYTLNIGRQMMECGAEAWRAENTMARIFRAYDLEVLDAHVIATQAAVTVKTPTGEHYTSTCMILPDKTGTDLGRLETLNAAARHICDAPPPLEELPLCLKRPVARWSWRELLGYLLGAGAFAIFFGGVFFDREKYPSLNQALDRIAETHSSTPTAIATAWLLRHPADLQVLSGTMKPERLTEMCQATEITLTRDEWYELLNEGLKLFPGGTK